MADDKPNLEDVFAIPKQSDSFATWVRWVITLVTVIGSAIIASR